MIASLCAFAVGRQSDHKGDVDKTFAEIKTLLPSIKRVAVQADDDSILSGRYRDRIPETRSMSEEDIYLFPDHSYVYTYMSDIAPEFITDQGDWHYSNGMIELKINPSKDNPSHNVRFLTLLFEGKDKTYQFLVGLDGDHEHFLEDARYPDLPVIVWKSSYKKTEPMNKDTYKEKKKYLLECCTNPRRYN